MPPHLHPRSTATSTLFAGTLLASFTVVAIPHIFPCPRPRTGRAYADAERSQFDADGNPIPTQQRRRRRRKSIEDDDSTLHLSVSSTSSALGMVPTTADRTIGSGSGGSTSKTYKTQQEQHDEDDETALFNQLRSEARMLEREAHECPVPKPGGVLGRLLGFGSSAASSLSSEQQQQQQQHEKAGHQDSHAEQKGRRKQVT